MNELAMVFDRMGIDTNEVVDGMNTKWNALGFVRALWAAIALGLTRITLRMKLKNWATIVRLSSMAELSMIVWEDLLQMQLLKI